MKSNLTDFVKISPNCSSRDGHSIKRITIHHCAGIASVEGLGAIFAEPSRQASSNYGIGFDGKVGQYVDESMRSWCSGSYDNDVEAITIECSNDSVGGDWHVSNVVINKLIELCVDICRRYDIKELKFTGKPDATLTIHKMFQATACPGPYLESKLPEITKKVNELLNTKKDIFEGVHEWALPSVRKIYDKGYLKGDGKGLNLSEDLQRIIVILDRAGVFT